MDNEPYVTLETARRQVDKNSIYDPFATSCCMEIIRLNEVVKKQEEGIVMLNRMIVEMRREDEAEPEDFTFGMDENITCSVCGNKLQIVRPGKYQCNYCEEHECDECGCLMIETSPGKWQCVECE